MKYCFYFFDIETTKKVVDIGKTHNQQILKQ